ncbi:unnamed protein product [Cercopithifilaria johnstoni]|uniref:Uncharacterized protein n=1 Tax=Cercopithifilaria johnstoni TaxID=2874296 RepID=A0A8J2LW44_9BILA|nr:unnamed protein product [Cercopithifilaria johnstoni]
MKKAQYFILPSFNPFIFYHYFLTALLFAWRLLLSNGEDERDEISLGLNRHDNSSSIKNIDGISASATSLATTAMEPSSIESLKALLSTDSISDDRLPLTATTGNQQHFLTESSFVPQCSSIQPHIEYSNNTYHNMERYLLAIPELEEENDELCGSQWSSSPSSASTAIPNTLFGSGTGIRPASSNFDQSISLGTIATDHTPDLINCDQPSNSYLVNLNQNPNSKLFSSDQLILTDSSSHPTILHQPISKTVLTVPHPTIPPPPPPFSSLKLLPSPLPQSKEIWNKTSPSLPLLSAETKVVTTITTGHLTFDIPDLPAIDSEDIDNNSYINIENLHNTSPNTAIIGHNLNNSAEKCSTNKLINFTEEYNMKRTTDIIFPNICTPTSPSVDHSNSRDRDQSEIVSNGLLDTISNEETCSLNSTSISIDHSRDSILDFSICSNPIDEAAIMEEQLAATGELNDDVPPIITTLSSRTSKDTGHSLTNRTIFSSATAVASTTDNNCQPVSPALSSLAMASRLPPLFNAPPIASLEDLTNGEQNSDITSARSNVATASAITFSLNGIGRSDLKEGRKTGRGRIGQEDGNGKGGDNDGDNDNDNDVSGRSDYYRQTSAASTTIKRYITRSGWFF